MADKHYVYGSGCVGCLYDFGPHCSDTVEGAIDSLLQVFDDISEQEAEELRANLSKGGSYRIHYFTDRSAAGADYCEISEQDGPCPEEDD